jgi:hypothetical protein
MTRVKRVTLFGAEEFKWVVDLLWRENCNVMKRVSISETSHRLQRIQALKFSI